MPMRQLRSCDFCGEEAAGVYEAVPPELSPTESEQRRVVLCSDCLETLETVLKPLLARLGIESTAGGSGGPVDPARTGPESPSSTARPRAVDSDDDNHGIDDHDVDDHDVDAVEEPDPEPRERPDEADPVDSGQAASAGDEADLVGGDDPADVDVDPVDDDGTVAWNQAQEQSETDDGDDWDVETTPDSTSDAVSEPPSVAEVDEEVLTEPEATEAEAKTDEEPEEFRTMMRLLGNREFPVEKKEIVELAASAYELDESHVERILDYAVARGVLEDDSGTIRKA